MYLDLGEELVATVEERKRVIVGFGYELHAAGVGQGLERVENLGRPELELLKHASGKRVADAESAFVLPDKVEHQVIGGQIALVGDLPAYLLVLMLIEIAGIAVEDRITPQPEGLMHLKIEHYRCHKSYETETAVPWSS